MATDLNKTLGYYQPFEWNQIPPTPIVSYPAAYPALSRRDYFILEVVKGFLVSNEKWKDQYEFARKAVGYADALLKEADKTQ